MGASERRTLGHEVGGMVAGLVTRARLAQRQYEKSDQAQVDEVVTAVGWAIVNPEHNRKLAETAVRDTGLGLARSRPRLGAVFASAAALRRHCRPSSIRHSRRASVSR